MSRGPDNVSIALQLLAHVHPNLVSDRPMHRVQLFWGLAQEESLTFALKHMKGTLFIICQIKIGIHIQTWVPVKHVMYIQTLVKVIAQKYHHKPSAAKLELTVVRVSHHNSLPAGLAGLMAG